MYLQKSSPVIDSNLLLKELICFILLPKKKDTKLEVGFLYATKVPCIFSLSIKFIAEIILYLPLAFFSLNILSLLTRITGLSKL